MLETRADHNAQDLTKEKTMSMHQCPDLAMVVVQQQHQELRREATQWRAAKLAASATTASTRWPWTSLKAVGSRVHATAAHRLSVVTSRVELRLSAR